VATGAGIFAAMFLFVPVWREMHHEEIRGQSSFGFLLQNLVRKERAQHIAASEAVMNAKARYMLGTLK